MTFEFIMTFIFGLIVGLIIGFLVSRNMIKKQTEQNPSMLFTDDMLAVFIKQTGAAPTPKRIAEFRKKLNAQANKK